MAELVKLYLRNNGLLFPWELEKRFNEDYFQKVLPMSRMAFVLAFFLYAVFGILDVFISPATKNFIWLIRYVIVCPSILIIFILSYLKVFKKIMQLSVSIVTLIIGFGIIAMIFTSQSVEGSLYYYAGLTLVIMWCYTFVRLRFIYATVVCWIIVFAYEFSIILFEDLLSSSLMMNAFISNNFFFVSSNIIGMFVCYHMEMYTRKDFLQRLLIEENQKKIEDEKITLIEWRRIMDSELDMARSIQMQIIPEDNPSHYISALFKPMAPIGGDFYDFIRFSEADKIGIFISDVSGHGVPAALITAMIKSLISDAGSSKLDPAQLLERFNEKLVKQSGKHHVTAFYGIYDMTLRTIKYSCAGHNPPYLIYEDKITELDKARSLPLGIMTNDELNRKNRYFSNHSQELPEGAKLLFYTDGLTEARSAENKIDYFESVMSEILPGLADLSCREFVAALYRELVIFNGGEDFEDDVCMVCVDIV